MISAIDLRDWVVIPTLKFMEPEIPYSKAAVRLSLGTIAKESDGGFWLDQTTLGPGPAYGITQMEEATYYDHCKWMTMVSGRSLFEKFCDVVPNGAVIRGPGRMRADLIFATFMMRVHYFRVPAALPTTLVGQAAYWKKYYNTVAGAGTPDQYIAAYQRIVGSAGENF